MYTTSIGIYIKLNITFLFALLTLPEPSVYLLVTGRIKKYELYKLIQILIDKKYSF